MRSKYIIIPLAFTALYAARRLIYPLLPLEPLGDAAWPLFFLTLTVVLPILLMSLIGGGFRQIIDDLGLTKNPIWATLFGLAVTAPRSLAWPCKRHSVPG